MVQIDMKQYEKNLCSKCTIGCKPHVYFYAFLKKNLEICSKYKICTKCLNRKEIIHFSKTQKNPAKVKTLCLDCKNAARRTVEYRTKERKRINSNDALRLKRNNGLKK